MEKWLTPDQERLLGADLFTMDGLLDDAERALAADLQDEHDPLARHRPDLSPEDRQAVSREIAALRSRLRDLLRDLRIERTFLSTQVSWAVQNALTFVTIALRERSAASLERIAPLPPEARALLERHRLSILQEAEHLRETIQRLAASKATTE